MRYEDADWIIREKCTTWVGSEQVFVYLEYEQTTGRLRKIDICGHVKGEELLRTIWPQAGSSVLSIGEPTPEIVIGQIAG